MIYGERIRLRAIEREDLPRLAAWLNDPEVRDNLLMRHGFHTLNLNRVFLRVYETNPGGIRAYEKAGFVHEGRMRQAEYRAGRYLDVLLMNVLRSEYKE